MKKTFAINGFGRIGRTAFRIWWQQHQEELELTAINTSGSMPIKNWVHLLKYDSNYGQFDPGITYEEHQSNKDVTDADSLLGVIKIKDKIIAVTAQKDPVKIPWTQLEVDIVLEATGKFLTQKENLLHLQAGAKKVLLTAPGKSEGISTSVLGVNEFDQTQDIFSNASCTTNCVAPVIAILHEAIGIQKALLTTVHAYTDGQNLLDNSNKDMRRARTAAINLIPTSTGAAQATTAIIPELDGLFDGLAVRTPVATGSLSDIVMLMKKDTTVEEINRILTEAVKNKRWQNSLAVNNDPIVSSDIVGRNESSIIDLEFTQVVGGNLVKVISWYDNEWGYCARLLDQLKLIKV